MNQFIAPKESLGNVDAELAATLLAAAADITLVIDNRGIIKDLAFDQAGTC